MMSDNTIACVDNPGGVGSGLLCTLQLHGRPWRSLYTYSSSAVLSGDSFKDTG